MYSHQVKTDANVKQKFEHLVRPPLHRKAKENGKGFPTKRKAEQYVANKPAKKRSAFGDITNAIGKSILAGKKHVQEKKSSKVQLPSCILGLAKPEYRVELPSNVFDPEKEAANFTTIEELEHKMDIHFSFDKKNINRKAVELKICENEFTTTKIRELAELTKPVEKALPYNVSDFEKETSNDLYSVSEYAYDIFHYYKQRETKFISQKYLDVQVDISRKMRAILVDWMVEVQESFELNHETLYLAVKLVDQYLSKVITTRETLQLVGSAAMFVACKFDERTLPLVDDFLYICDDAYQRDELLEMERKLVKSLDFDLGIPLSYRFLRRYSRCAGLSLERLTFARYILETSLMEYDFINILESMKAASALCLALIICKENYWTPTMQFYSGYSLDEIRPFVEEMHKMILQSKSKQQKTVSSKYSHRVFFEVAHINIPLKIEV